MGLRIQNNVEAFNAHRQLSATRAQASKSMEKLSTGYRINRAADDAAGLAISEKMRAQIGGLAQAQRNAQDGISLVQTAEGALNEVHSMLQRVRDLKVQFDNGTLDADDQDAIAAEVAQLAKEIKNIVRDTAVQRHRPLFDAAGTFTFQVGANDGETITIDRGRPAPAHRVGGLERHHRHLDRRRRRHGPVARAAVDARPRSTPRSRTSRRSASEFGAVQNRLEHRLNNLATYQENLTASE